MGLGELLLHILIAEIVSLLRCGFALKDGVLGDRLGIVGLVSDSVEKGLDGVNSDGVLRLFLNGGKRLLLRGIYCFC